jgi:UDP-4-amino-4,6-dideoxy-N-acetyl-beta-L-altrosamine transaminase
MKMIPYGRQSIDERDIREVVKVLRSDWITQGPLIKEFEASLCRFTGARYAVAVSSGTAALHCACLAAGIRPGDEVITSPLTFAASANCVLYCGGKPVFADIQPDTGNINPAEIRKKISARTRAIIPVHFAGHPCDLDEIGKIARDRKILVIEDAAHALGAEYKGSKTGSCEYSAMTILSFHPVKHITTGEGGAVLTNSERLYRKLSLARNHGITKDPRFLKRSDGSWYYEMQELGFNYRVTDFQCALGISQMKKLKAFLQKRRELVRLYYAELDSVDGITLPVERPGVTSAWHLFPVRMRMNRRQVFDHLRSKGIGVQVHYIPVYLQPYYRRLGYVKGACPVAEQFYAGEISLPLHPELRDKEIVYISTVIKSYIRENGARS